MHRALIALLLLAACGPTDEPLHESHDGHVWSSGLPVTCAAHLEHYPINGPHNGGYDSNALNFTCPDHPSSSPDNSDWIDGDHYGNDLFADRGTPVVAVVSGTIVRYGYTSVGGNRITIQDSCGWHYYYAHLDSYAPGLSSGTYVEAGQNLGTVGDTGNAVGTQPHVHFSIYPDSYNNGVDPFDYLQGVDAESCTGAGSYSGGDPTSPDDPSDPSDGPSGPSGPGDEPDAGWNPCVDDDIVSTVRDASFALVSGATEARPETGGSTGEFLTAPPFSNLVELAVGKWAPWISHTGEWSLEAFVPETSTDLATSAIFDVAFHGGRSLSVIDLDAAKGSWVPITPEPLKFVEGPTGYASLSNLTPDDGGWLAFDAMRWVYEGPTGSGGIGTGCSLSKDCSGNLICGESGTCEADCTVGGCDVGICDAATAVCVEPDEIDETDPFGGVEYSDSDGDGILNYLEGFGDDDGDGLPNYLDMDSDDDGIPDSVEGSNDTDHDGVMDFLDEDADGDGILDADEVGDPEVPLDSDLDGLPDFQDDDSDNDGIPDSVEVGHPEDPTDTDGDGIPNHLDTDSDNDGVSDGQEAGWEPTEPADDDGNGVPDYLEPGSGSISDGPGSLVLPDAPGPAGSGCSVSGGASPLWGLLVLPLFVRRWGWSGRREE